ncbi:MAG TPA: 50S ribosomal protein L10, partial [Thermoplasmata archaeon]|nr:50S ribosomal protein L10 [Thermoplasmata archaeon]
MPGRAAVRPEKIATVNALRSALVGRPLTALVGIRGVPAAALQQMRRGLRDRGHPITVVPNSQLRHALESAVAERPALRPLVERVVDQTAVLTAEGNPFSLYSEFARTRSPTPARGGETAPAD